MEPPHRRGAGSDQGPQPQPRGQPWPACSAPAEGRGSADSGGLRPGLRGAAARAAPDPRANIQRKRVSSVSKENTLCKYMKTSSEITQKNVCTVSKKEEKLLEKIRLIIYERMDILNNDFFNQKLESLNRRLLQVQCKKNHGEIAMTFLRKLSKLERRINAVIIFQEEALSNIAVHQIMLPSADYQNGILNHLGHSAFFPNIINTEGSSSNTFLLSSHTDFTSASVSEYKSSDEVRLISVERRNSATTNNSVIVHYQIPTQEEMTGKVQSEVKGGKLKVMGIIQEESHNCSKGQREEDQKLLSN
ncbi:activating transcription factor 7-interacting protein 2 [Cygnus atratus]|uniref:activating transcription factor 7-interacting protein 2 n=1 Tax=Cygnus atratus TaxID=8868 RepID=UPI0021B71806|nr:activating transcription factor 7-interacting protein 2 [Cygnus atratus]